MQMCLQDSTEVVMSNSECLSRSGGEQASRQAGRLVGRVGGNKRAGRAEGTLDVLVVVLRSLVQFQQALVQAEAGREGTGRGKK